MKTQSFTVTTRREGSIDVTDRVQRILSDSGVRSGICVVYTPHTTAGLTINENADPDVQDDMLLGLGLAYPERPEFRHFERNSHAHLKASALGFSHTLLVEDGRLLLGRWQAVYLVEFDGPKSRQVHVKIMADA